MSNAQQQPTFDKYLTAWKWAVAGQKKDTWPIEIVAKSRSEFDAQADALLRAQKDAKAKGYECRFNVQIKGTRLAAWATSKSHTIKVVFDSKAKRPQAVTQTSREAYHAIDFTTQRGQIAQAIFEYTVLNGISDVTRKEIEVWQRLGCNQVTGRTKELLELSEKQPFVFGGKPYRLQVVSTRLSNCEGASNVPNEALRWVEVKEAGVSAQKPVQAAFFQ